MEESQLTWWPWWVVVEFGELCQIVNIPYKQETWWLLGSLQHLRGVMVLLLTSTLGK